MEVTPETHNTTTASGGSASPKNLSMDEDDKNKSPMLVKFAEKDMPASVMNLKQQSAQLS